MYRLALHFLLCLLLSIPLTTKAFPETGSPDTSNSCPHDKNECIQEMKRIFEKRGAMGFSILPHPRPRSGRPEMPFDVVEVIPGDAADKANFQVGDVIVAWNDTQITSATADLFVETHRDLEIGAEVRYTLLRGREEVKVTLVAEPPESETVRAKLRFFVTSTYGSEAWLEYARTHPP